jgi:hypothetical protein
LSTASRDVAPRRTKAKARPKPITIVIIVLVGLLSIGLVAISWPALGLWPFGQGAANPVGMVTPTSHFASGLTLEKQGEPVKEQVKDGDTVTYNVTVTVKLTNGVQQPPAASGTPTPGAPTPAPEPAKVYNATVKAIFYDRAASDPARQVVGSGVGNYHNPEGLEYGASDTMQIVATGLTQDFVDYEVFPDTVWTDKDPIKTPEPQSLIPAYPASAGRIP